MHAVTLVKKKQITVNYNNYIIANYDCTSSVVLFDTGMQTY